MAKITITPNKKPKLFQKNVVYLLPESRPRIYTRRASYVFNFVLLALLIYEINNPGSILTLIKNLTTII